MDAQFEIKTTPRTVPKPPPDGGGGAKRRKGQTIGNVGARRKMRETRKKSAGRVNCRKRRERMRNGYAIL